MNKMCIKAAFDIYVSTPAPKVAGDSDKIIKGLHLMHALHEA